jgi:general secretion pathway protein B
MSYILDALKKAEQERRRGKAPDIMTDTDGTVRRPEKRLWPYAVLIILVAAAGSLGWFFGHEQTDTSSLALQGKQNYVVPVHPQTQPKVQTATTPAEMASGTQPTTASGSSQGVKEEKSGSHNAPSAPLDDKRNLSKSLAKPIPGDNRSASANKEPGRVVTSKSSQDRSAEEIRPQPEHKPVADNKIYTINELPEAVRQGLPSLTISTHIYASEKSERLAAINGHIGREGQEVMTGIMLESITPDGAILRYQGYKFRVSLK